jgi:hypothetical protein
VVKWTALALLIANLAVAAFFVGRGYWPKTPSVTETPINVGRLSLRGQTSSTPAAPRQKAAEALCIEWRGLTLDEIGRVREQLKSLAGERVMSFTEVPLDTRRWVIFPPLPSPESAVAKLAELAAAGVADAVVVSDGAWRNALSLGVYADDAAARQRVQELEEKGVLGTRIELQARRGTDFYFVIRSEDQDVLKSLGGIKQAYPNSQQSRVACPS